MGSMEARGISPAKGTGHYLFPSQSADLIAGLSAPPQNGRLPNSPSLLQVRHFSFGGLCVSKQFKLILLKVLCDVFLTSLNFTNHNAACRVTQHPPGIVYSEMLCRILCELYLMFFIPYYLSVSV